MRQRNAKNRKATCSKCGGKKEANRINQGYCRKCRNEHNAKHRKSYSELNDRQKKKSIARAISKQYLYRGKLPKKPCEYCGAEKTEMHHPDYNAPLVVIWLCRNCHTMLHAGNEDILKKVSNKITTHTPKPRKKTPYRIEICIKCNKQYMRRSLGKLCQECSKNLRIVVDSRKLL